MIKRTYARLRRDLIGDDRIIPTSPPIASNELETLNFICMQLDSQDPTAFIETDHPDGYNMLILHPVTKRIHWCYSADFDFVDEPKQTFTVRFKYSEIREFEMEADSMTKVLESWLEASFCNAEPIQHIDEELISIKAN